MQRSLVPFALSLAVLGLQTASAEVYKWIDAEGRVYFSDRPAQAGAETVHMPGTQAGPAGAPAAPAAAAAPSDPPEERLEKQRKLLHAFEEERRQKRDTQEQERQDQAERQHNCVLARDNLQSLEQASGVYQLGPDGERIFLDEAQREQSLAGARAAVEQWCGEF